MKIDRLYALTVYLLNHGKTPASVLARRFEVSVRTIQRDIDALCRAGIPVSAVTGANGGYELTDTFSMQRHAATKTDYAHIRTALRGLATATNDPEVGATLEKLSALSGPDESGLILDFSVLREGDETLLRTLQSAIRQKRAVSFSYTNAENVTRTHTVEPVAAVYRWYAWYLLAYSRVRDDYRTYKLVRMRDLEITDSAFTREHASADALLRAADQKDPRPVTTVKVRCEAEAKARAVEYLNGNIIEEFENGDALMTLHVMENEAFWLGMLLSLGGGIEVTEPEYIRKRILAAAETIVKLYRKL